MAVPGDSINPDSYRLSGDEFEPYERDENPYPEVKATIAGKERTDGPYVATLDGPDEEWKKRLAYTVGLDLSDCAGETIPILSLRLPRIDIEREKERLEKVSRRRDITGLESISTLFVKRNKHGRLESLGPIAKFLRVTHESEGILLLQGVDNLPGKAQSLFFGLLERATIQYGIEIQGDPDNLIIFTTTDSSADREELDFKFARLLGMRLTR